MKAWISDYGRPDVHFSTEDPGPGYRGEEVEVGEATLERWEAVRKAWYDLTEELHGLAVAAQERRHEAREAALVTVPVRLECGHEGVMPEDEIHTQLAWCGRCSHLQGFTVIQATAR